MQPTSNKEVAEHIRVFVKNKNELFCWPTDGCSLEQHLKFVKHRNTYWTKDRAETQTFEEFLLEYANSLEKL